MRDVEVTVTVEEVDTGWLIEKHGPGGGPMWWQGWGWTTVADRAIRYARKLDAERTIEHVTKLLDGMRDTVSPFLSRSMDGAAAIEHQWGPAPKQAVG